MQNSSQKIIIYSIKYHCLKVKQPNYQRQSKILYQNGVIPYFPHSSTYAKCFQQNGKTDRRVGTTTRCWTWSPSKVYYGREKSALRSVRKRSGEHCIVVGQFRDDPNQRLVEDTAQPAPLCSPRSRSAITTAAPPMMTMRPKDRPTALKPSSFSFSFLNGDGHKGNGADTHTHMQVSTQSFLAGFVISEGTKRCNENAALDLASPNLSPIPLLRAERAGEKEGGGSCSVTYGETRSACLISDPDQI